MQPYRKLNKVDFQYKLEGVDLVQVEAITYLGVNITRDITWNKHVTEVCSKASRSLGLLQRNLANCPQEVKLQAYKGLVRPILDYASAIWDPHTLILSDQLEKVQRRSARFITSDYTYEPGSMTKMLTDLKLQPLKNRRQQNRLILLYTGLNSKANIPIDDLETPLRRTRHMHEQHFKQLYASTDTYKFSFIPRTVKDWNQIDQSVLNVCKSATDSVAKFTEIIRKD